MSWFKNPFKQAILPEPKEEEELKIIVPEPQSIVITAKVPKKKPYTFGSLRNNRWVVVQGRVGIVTSFEPEVSTVDFVDSNGFTVTTERVHTAYIRIAKWREVPDMRKIGFTDEDGQRLGYPL